VDRAGGIRGTDLAARRWRSAWPVHLATLAAAFLLLLRLNQGQWFLRDEWAFLVDRGGPDDPGIFEPHNEHWTTIPILVYRALFAVFGVRTYVPYVVVLIVVHLVAAHLLWRVMRRAGADAWVATAAVPILLVFGPGADNLVSAFQITFVGSVAFGLGHVLLADHTGGFGRRDVLGWGLALGGLMCSGIGIPMTAAAGLTALGRRGVVGFLQTAGPPTLVFALWLVTAGGRILESGGADELTVALLGGYVWTGVRTTVEAVAGPPAAALLLTAATGGGIVLLLVRRRVPVPALACAAGVVGLFLLTGFGRAEAGSAPVPSPRYAYVAAALLLPLFAVALSEIGRLAPALWLVPCLAAVVAAGAVLVELGRRAEAQAERDGFAREVILAASRPEHLEGPLLTDTPDPRDAPNLQLDELLALRDAGDLPPAPPPSDEALLQVALGLQVAVETGDPRAESGAATVHAKGMRLEPDGSCLVATPFRPRPRLEIVSEGVRIGMRAASEVSAALVRDGVRTRVPRRFDARDVLITLGVPGAATVFRFQPSDEVLLCGAGPR